MNEPDDRTSRVSVTAAGDYNESVAQIRAMLARFAWRDALEVEGRRDDLPQLKTLASIAEPAQPPK